MSKNRLYHHHAMQQTLLDFVREYFPTNDLEDMLTQADIMLRDEAKKSMDEIMNHERLMFLMRIHCFISEISETLENNSFLTEKGGAA